TVSVLGRDVGKFRRNLVHARKLRVDLSRNEVSLAKRREKLVETLPLLRHQLQDEERGNEAVIRIEVVAEIVMPGDFTAENRIRLAHPSFEERVADAVHERGAAVLLDDVTDRVA